MLKELYKGKKVLVTGHTGFKGSWMCQVLLNWGAEVYGVSLEPNTNPSLFQQLELSEKIKGHFIQDIRNFEELNRIIIDIQPDITFHMAAQPLVRYSYSETLETFETNVMGTANLLESFKKINNRSTIVVITTDKCYHNNEWFYGYRETDPLGGKDPYSASKACAEIVSASYRNSFFGEDSLISLATVRAGNVLGGGDWALDRIIPDCIRFLSSNEEIVVRNPHAIRPWQHVLEPISGYLKLGMLLHSREKSEIISSGLDSAFNFGPNEASCISVKELVDKVLEIWPGSVRYGSKEMNSLEEAKFLKLVSDKAGAILNWYPVWDIDLTIHKTIEWYRQVQLGSESAQEVTNRQINEYYSL